MKITTLPVYSKLADEAEVRALGLWDKLPVNPDGTRWRLSRHQVETYKALTRGDCDVVLNTAMTGDGKSLAAYLQTLVNGRSTLAMYPTNELARDQEAQLQRDRRRWSCEELRVIPMSARRMDALIAAGLHDRKADVVRHLVDNYDVVLTNPDIFHYLAQFYYTRKDDAPDRLFGRKVVDLFDLFVFDEFHIFQAPQVVAVLNALLLIREVSGMTRPKRFLFLSATPDPHMREYLAKAGFRVRVVQPETDGDYAHATESMNATDWRLIVRASDVHFWESGAERRAEEWAAEHLEDTFLNFFRRHRPGAKGAFIVNGIATAHRLFARLEPAFRAEGFSVSLNTGFTGEELKRASLDADLLIATSTVDVGVDFRINFLAFESRDAGTFLQRLGRLGRHADDGRGHPFATFEAHALLPAFVCERLFQAKDPLLLDSARVTRTDLGGAIRKAFPQHASFPSYAREWGWVQCAHTYSKLNHPTVRDTYATARANLKQVYWAALGIGIERKLREYLGLLNGHRPIAEEARTFRGESPFECGAIDAREAGPDGVKRYDLLTLAPNAELDWLGPEEFKHEARRRGAPVSPTQIKGLAGWFRFRGFTESRRPMTIGLRAAVSAWSADELGEVQVIDGVELDVAGVGWSNDLNSYLRRRKLVATLCLTPPAELRYRLHLPPMFDLLPFEASDGTTGSIAFAREALLLHVALKERWVPCGGGAIVV